MGRYTNLSCSCSEQDAQQGLRSGGLRDISAVRSPGDELCVPSPLCCAWLPLPLCALALFSPLLALLAGFSSCPLELPPKGAVSPHSVSLCKCHAHKLTFPQGCKVLREGPCWPSKGQLSASWSHPSREKQGESEQNQMAPFPNRYRVSRRVAECGGLTQSVLHPYS